MICHNLFNMPLNGFKKIGSRIFFVFMAMTLSAAVSSHEGHQDEDIILNDLGDLGEVQFTISCNAESQEAFNTGVALLHHMMYAQAEMLFQKWSKKNANCAMLHWGYAMSLFHPLWPDTISEKALKAGQHALDQTKGLTVSKRERFFYRCRGRVL